MNIVLTLVKWPDTWPIMFLHVYCLATLYTSKTPRPKLTECLWAANIYSLCQYTISNNSTVLNLLQIKSICSGDVAGSLIFPSIRQGLWALLVTSCAFMLSYNCPFSCSLSQFEQKGVMVWRPIHQEGGYSRNVSVGDTVLITAQEKLAHRADFLFSHITWRTVS